MRTLLLAGLVCIAFTASAQKYKSNKSYVKFFSEATLEDIAAENKDGVSVIDLATGNVVFSIPIKSFEFEKSLMKEHFNEKYMESEKYPKAVFKGVIDNVTDQAGIQKVKAKGDMTIHGVTKKMEAEGEIDKTGDTVLLKTQFMVRLEDHKVKIPKLLWQNIAEVVEVTVDFEYKPIEQ